MTVSAVGFSGPTYVQIPGNGAATAFSFPFLISAATDLKVGFIAGGSYSQQTSGFTVTGVGSSGGGQVTFATAPPSGTTVDIRSVIPETQPTNFSNLGGYYPENTTNALDRTTRLVADLYRLTYQFGIHGPDTESVAWTALPPAASRANTNLTFDSNGLPMCSVVLNSAQQIVLSAALLGGFLFPQTAQEAAANVVPTKFQYQYGPLRYGAIGNGGVDDAAAWNAMGSIAGYQLIPDGTYLCDENVITSQFITWEGWTRQNTIIEPSATLTGSLLQIGNYANGPNPNVGQLKRLRFLNGTANLTAMLYMSQLSHMWRLDDLLFQDCSCPALIVNNCWDSNYTNIDMLVCGYVNQPANVGAAFQVINGCNNLYFRGIRVEQCSSGAIYIGTNVGPVYIVEGKIDQGFIRQYDAAFTIDTNAVVLINNFVITGVRDNGVTDGSGTSNYSIYCAGSLKMDHVIVSGGTGSPAHMLDVRAWGQTNGTTNPTYSVEAYGPAIAEIDLGESQFNYSDPSVSLVTPAVLYSKIPLFRYVSGFTVTANGTVSGNSIVIQTNLTNTNFPSAVSATSNNSLVGLYLVYNGSGTTAGPGLGYSRRRVLTSFTNGQLVVAGNWNVTISGTDTDWSLEYCAGHYTPNLHADGITIDQNMTLCAVLQTGCTISGVPSYQVVTAGAAGGATNFTISATAFPASTDATGFYLVDEVTGEAFLITYGVDGSSKIAVAYNRVASINTAHTYSIVAGYYAGQKVVGASLEWSFAGKRKTALLSALNAAGFDQANFPVWGYGKTGEPVLLPYSTSIAWDVSQTREPIITATNGTAFTITSPVNTIAGEVYYLTISNTSGGSLGTITWGSAFKVAAISSPATGNQIVIQFYFDGTYMRQMNTPVSIPN